MIDTIQAPARKIRPRPRRVNVRYSEEEYHHLVEQAHIANLRPAAFLREMSLGACLKPVPRLPRDVYRAVRSFGGNLNQLARQANMGRADVQAVEALRESVNEILKAMHR